VDEQTREDEDGDKLMELVRSTLQASSDHNNTIMVTIFAVGRDCSQDSWFLCAASAFRLDVDRNMRHCRQDFMGYMWFL